MTSRIAATLVFVFVLSGSALADRTMRGIRSAKCAVSPEDAKTEMIVQMSADKKLCEEGWSAVQAGGWSCKQFDCKKGTYRCNTQYVCEGRAIDISPKPLPSMAAASPSARPSGKLDKPAPMPNAKVATVGGGGEKDGEVVGRKEVKDGDKTYIQETKIGKDGTPVTTVVPKKGNAKVEEIVPASEKVPAPAGPTAAPTGASGGNPALDRFLDALAKCEKAVWSLPKSGNSPEIRHEILGKVGGKCKVVRSIADVGTWKCLFSDADLKGVEDLKRAKMPNGDAFSLLLKNENTCPMSPPDL